MSFNFSTLIITSTVVIECLCLPWGASIQLNLWHWSQSDLPAGCNCLVLSLLSPCHRTVTFLPAGTALHCTLITRTLHLPVAIFTFIASYLLSCTAVVHRCTSSPIGVACHSVSAHKVHLWGKTCQCKHNRNIIASSLDCSKRMSFWGVILRDTFSQWGCYSSNYRFNVVLKFLSYWSLLVQGMCSQRRFHSSSNAKCGSHIPFDQQYWHIRKLCFMWNATGAVSPQKRNQRY